MGGPSDFHDLPIKREIRLRAGLPVPDTPLTAEEIEAIRQREHADAAEARHRMEVARHLAAVVEPTEAIELLTRHPEDVAYPDVLSAWVRLVSNAPAPPFEIAGISGRHTLLGHRPSRGHHFNQGAWKESPPERIPVWRAPAAGRHLVPRLGEIDERWESGWDVWLQKDGTLWGGTLGKARLRIHYSEARVSSHIVVPRGARFVTEPKRDEQSRHREVLMPSAVVSVEQRPTDGYVAAVVAALREMG
jgi:hypothetical protein